MLRGKAVVCQIYGKRAKAGEKAQSDRLVGKNLGRGVEGPSLFGEALSHGGGAYNHLTQLKPPQPCVFPSSALSRLKIPVHLDLVVSVTS